MSRCFIENPGPDPVNQATIGKENLLIGGNLEQDLMASQVEEEEKRIYCGKEEERNLL